ncbi:TraB/GumN family protein [Hellea sp.]|nr:TraB/GumN family protein [Hellea sp.]
MPVIKDLLDEPGTKFVAVGAGHLAGPDSVVTMLKKDGIKVKAVN